MSKAEFLRALRANLGQMPPEELAKQLAYYEELIDDMLEDGMSEQDAMAKLGDPAAVAQELLTQLPLATLVKTGVRPKGGWTVPLILLMILGAPCWLPIVISIGAVLLSLLIVLWVLVLVYAVVVLALGLSAIAILAAVPFGLVSVSPWLAFGASLICGGLCVLGALAVPPICRGAAKLCASLFRGIKSLFIRKEK